MSTIDEQKALEASRNTRYQWISCLFNILLLLAHGIIFYWIPRAIRLERYVKSNRFKPIFRIFDIWQSLNFKFSIKIRHKQYFFKPSMLLLFLCFILLNGKFSYIETSDLDYQSKNLIIAKRCARVGLGSLPAMFLLIAKGDFVNGIFGISNDRGYFFHKWFSNMMFVLVSAHVIIMCYYWSQGLISPTYPKSAYGIIGYVTYVILQFGNNRYLRKWFYEGIMINHRVQSFIMLLVVFLHNDKAKAMVVLGVHLLVLDKVVNRIIGIVHYKKSPTKGYSRFEILNDEYLKVSIPIKTHAKNFNKWFNMLNYKYGSWKPGSHIYLNVRKIDFFQHHPFCIASLPEDKEIVLIIKTQKGFTKKLHNKVEEVKTKQLNGDIKEPKKSKSAKFAKVEDPNIVKFKTMFRGPSGAKFHPLTTFDGVGFIIEDLGASFALPICLDLLQNIRVKNESKELLFRPTNPIIKLYWSIETQELVKFYDYIIDKLKPFISSGHLTIDIFLKEMEMKDIETNTVINKDISVIETTKSESLLKYNNEMEISNIIFELVSLMKPEDPKNFKSLGILSCGHNNFGDKIEYEIQKYRWVKDAPNLYFYNESFNT
ncbi:unnamed protein product [Candida verbasci]|uniref:ferric-chelate reductase (NADPH) n=1 Tax=Candida verbasci TaxID=1227364 RepID=A0A9W4XC27_9ASCO|nr:unnamed protein product [Candida verbasci]